VFVELVRTVLRKTRDRGLGRVPIAAAVHIQIGRPIRKSADGVAEGGHGFAGLNATQLHLAVVDTPVGGPLGRGRSDIDGTRHAAASGVAPQVRRIPIEPERQGMLPVHILGDDRGPLVVKVPGQLELHRRVVDGDGGGHDQQVAVLSFP